MGKTESMIARTIFFLVVGTDSESELALNSTPPHKYLESLRKDRSTLKCRGTPPTLSMRLLRDRCTGLGVVGRYLVQTMAYAVMNGRECSGCCAPLC